MKRANKYVCDYCHMLLDPRAVYSVSIAKIDPLVYSRNNTEGIYTVSNEYHFCPKCLQLVQARIEQSVSDF